MKLDEKAEQTKVPHNAPQDSKKKTKDRIFTNKLDEVAKFEFNQQVADVFDDMVNRSVPFYNETHKILLDILRRYPLPQQAPIIDLGCSTAETLYLLSQQTSDHPLIGVDNSEAMIEKSRKKLENKENIALYCDDIRQMSSQYWQPAAMVIMNYTLQFVPLEDRDELLKEIYRNLKPGGIFFLAEKVRGPSHRVESLLTDLYYDFKRRNGYSELEIAQKREALEDVLIPLSADRQMAMLREAGFQEVEMIFCWYNFACYIGIK